MRADYRRQRQIARNDDFTTLSNPGYLEESSIQKSKSNRNFLKMAKTVDMQPHPTLKTRHFHAKICVPYQQISADCSLS